MLRPMAPRLRAITVGSYRCFAEPFRLELRPLTLVYGWNNAGKSAAVRLVGILADSIRETARAVLDLSGAAGGGSSFDRVQWKGLSSTEPTGVWLTLEWSDAPVRKACYRLDFDTDLRRIYVRELEVFGDADEPLARALALGEKNRYQLARRGVAEPSSTEIRFTGLVPRHDEQSLMQLHEQLSALRGRLQWMGTGRAAPQESIPEDAPPPVQLAHDGSGCVEKLLADRMLLEEVARWYARPEIDRVLLFRPDGTRRRLLLNPKATSFDVDLVDAGSGMAQVLPVLTGVALGRSRDAIDGGYVLAAEEPESNLHVNAQRALAQWLCEHAKNAADGTSFVFETHSRALILAIQLAVARGELPASSLAVYWLEQREDGSTHAAEVSFDRMGKPSNGWPSDAFADERELAVLLLDEQLGAIEDDAP
jgi:AAA domain, putative AbiEii toxin, Type IV TA system